MEGFFKQAVDKAQGMFAQEGPSVIGLDISSAAVKVVQLKEQSGRAKLETYGEIALGPYGNKEVGQAVELSIDQTTEAMRDVLREAKITTHECGVAIPMSASLTSFIEVPTTTEEKLNELVPIEARKHIPVPISEVFLDWHVIPQEEQEFGQGEQPKEGKTQVLVVAIHKESISNYQHIIEKSELNASFFEIEVFSTIRSSLNSGVKPVMIIDFGVSTTKIYIVEHGLVRRSHTVNRGAQDVSSAVAKSLGTSFGKAEELKRQFGIKNADVSEEGRAVQQSAATILEFVFSKAQQVLLDFQRQHNKSVSKTVLTGGGAMLPGMLAAADQEFDTDVERADPFSTVRSPAFLDDTLRQAGPEFAVALGVALRKLEEVG